MEHFKLFLHWASEFSGTALILIIRYECIPVNQKITNEFINFARL